jgi:hypothetical protein
MIAIGAGCASAPPPEPISAQDRERFQATLAAGKQLALWDCPRGSAALRAAEADFYYAENSPRDPARAKQIAAEAQRQAEAALEQCRAETAYRRPPASKAPTVADGL